MSRPKIPKIVAPVDALKNPKESDEFTDEELFKSRGS